MLVKLIRTYDKWLPLRFICIGILEFLSTLSISCIGVGDLLVVKSFLVNIDAYAPWGLLGILLLCTTIVDVDAEDFNV